MQKFTFLLVFMFVFLFSAYPFHKTEAKQIICCTKNSIDYVWQEPGSPTSATGAAGCQPPGYYRAHWKKCVAYGSAIRISAPTASVFETNMSILTNDTLVDLDDLAKNLPTSGFKLNSSAPAVQSALQVLYRLGFSPYNPPSTATTFGPTSTEATKNMQAAFGLTPTGIFDNTIATAAKNLADQLGLAINVPTSPTNAKNLIINFPGDKTFSTFDPITGVFIHSPQAPSPTCGGVKQPPCVQPFVYHCCDASGDNCLTTNIPGSCSGDGNSFCPTLPGGFGNCRDVF